MQLAEQYRPTTWDDVVGQPEAVKALRAIVARGAGGRAYWLTGGSGQGKTTIGRILASELADPLNIIELDAGDVTPSKLADIERGASTYGIGVKTGRAYIVNESHALRRDTIGKLLVMLERIPDHVCWIFTTTTDGQEQFTFDKMDANPLLSRCLRIDLSRRGLAEAFAERAREIATAAGLNGQPIEAYVRLAKQERNNLRSMLQRVDAGEMTG